LSCRIAVGRSAEKSLRRQVPPRDAERIRRAIDDLAEDPRPRGSLRLRGKEGRRIRVGEYRIVYEVDDDQLIITILQVGHRRDVYRRG
jgi:mRNA interferase RelE/StbE